jgi:hypothetical protein
VKLKGAEILLECFKRRGVDTIFGYPGADPACIRRPVQFRYQACTVRPEQEQPMQLTLLQGYRKSRGMCFYFRPGSYKSGYRIAMPIWTPYRWFVLPDR